MDSLPLTGYNRSTYMVARTTLKSALKRAIAQAQHTGSLPSVTTGDFSVARSPRLEQGDYSTSVAMQLAAQLGKKPKTVAKILRDELVKDEKLSRIVREVQVAPPGFINFYLSSEYVRRVVAQVVKNPDSIYTNVGRKKKLNIEFISLNPTGEMHVGHGRTAFYGDVLARVLSVSGYAVTREYYINNAKQSAQIKELGKTALGKGISYKSAYLDALLKQYKKQLAGKKSAKEAGYFLAAKIQKDTRALLERIGVRFDVWKEEEELYKKREVEKTFATVEKMGLVYKKDGAVWLKTTRFGDAQDQVLVRSNGESTYFMADIAYHRNKSRRGFDQLIDIWGADHQGHVRRMKAAMRIFGVRKVEILISQLVRLKGGLKLSKRKGTSVTLADLVQEVGLDSARYFYLTKSLDSQMEFDFALARQHSKKNPVFYIQYTHARICSIMRKNGTVRLQLTPSALAVLTESGELELARMLAYVGDVVEDTARDYQVHRLTTYTHQLAQQFNQFYRDYKVIVDDEALRNARLALAVATGAVLKQCLDLLGISAPKRL